MFSWSSALVEGTILTLILGALALHEPLRATFMRAPLRLRLGMGAIVVVWLVSQLAEIRLATYPFMSWHMYGESRNDAPVSGYRLQGVTCTGETTLIPANERGLGRRPVLSFGLTRAYEDVLDPRATPAARDLALARTDSLLVLALERFNERHQDAPLCAVNLQRISIAPRDIGRSPLPPYHTVRRHDHRR